MNNLNDFEKEKYLKPECNVIIIESEGILCASDKPDKGVYGESDRWGGNFGEDF